MNQPKLERQYRGCGHEPRLDDHVRLTVWQPPSGNERAGYRGPEMTVCPGFTTRLPEVVETAMARRHWEHGNLASVGHTEESLDAIVILDSQYSHLEAWLMVPSKDGGGGS